MKKFIWFYVLMIVIVAIYGNWWGDFAYRGFGYNLGRALFWPFVMFPGVGKAVGGIIIVGLVLFAVFFMRNPNE